jgi:hypothetical protein
LMWKKRWSIFYSFFFDDEWINCVGSFNVRTFKYLVNILHQFSIFFAFFDSLKKVCSMIEEARAHKCVMHQMLSDHKLIHYLNEHRTIAAHGDGLSMKKRWKFCIIEACDLSLGRHFSNALFMENVTPHNCITCLAHVDSYRGKINHRRW